MRFSFAIFLVLTAAVLRHPLPAAAQPLDVQARGADGKPHILAFLPGTQNTGELVLFDETGHRQLSRTIPLALRAVCIAPDAGFVAAPTAGGLLYLDRRMRVKIHIPGYAYETLACYPNAVYAAGRTTRIHRFDFPSLLHRQVVAEVDSFVPRLLASEEGIAAVSWDGSAVIIRPNALPLRLHVSSRSLVGLAPGPQNSWITLAENHRITVIDSNGAKTGLFQVEDARMLAASPQGTLAVLDSDNEVVFYRRVKPYWVIVRRRIKLPDSLKPTAMAHLSGQRWVVLASAGIAFFEEPH